MLKGLFGSRPVRAASVLALACLQGGCAVYNELQNKLVESLASPDPPKTQAEAASTHLAVITAARWDSYAGVIQPKFTITEKDAFDQAIPTTASYQSRLVEAYRLGITAGLAQTGTSSTRTEAIDATGAVTETSERTTTTSPGVAPPVPTSLGTVPGAASLPVLSATLGDDPFLRYGVAADLFQEVTMLNRALTDAVVRDQVEPYLVRVKVGVLPYRRDFAADAYSDLSFFLRTKDQPRASGLVHLPVVVPLLVTDNLESATDTASAQFIAELSAALTATAYNAQLSGELKSLGDRLTSALANERNTLRTVVRLGENAIRVRLGATQQAGPAGRKAYALLPRTHTISLLVLVPRAAITTAEPPRLAVVADTFLKNVDRGDTLALSRYDDFEERFENIAAAMKIDERIKEGGRNCLNIVDTKSWQ